MTDASPPRLGFSGRIARTFQQNPLTPIIAILGLLLGLVAVLITPREEEPQIDVTMANVIVPFPGADAHQVEQLVSYPLEQVLQEIEGIKHVYSISRPGMVVATAEFTVGVPRQEALVRLYNQIWSNQDWMPQDVGVGQPVVKPMGIDDVPVMTLTLWSDDPQQGAFELAQVAHTLETELKRVPGTRDVYTVGAPDRGVVVTLDPARLSSHGLALEDVVASLQAANVVRHAGERTAGEGAVPLTAGRFLADSEEIAELVLTVASGRPIRLRDVADIQSGADLPIAYVWHGAPAGRDGPAAGSAPAVTLAIAKKPGSNAADITGAVAQRLQGLRGQTIPDGVNVEITRDYGLTATDKAQTLIKKLIFATLSVVLLVLLALGRREAVVVGSAVVLTLAMTLFASWAMSFTLNRVSLFALIFSIGILVDDAIVVVENIHRHMAMGGKTLREAIPEAVDEVGGPTILATFTVIAALLPMAFVSGLMGPYMRPIPINASVGMLLSLGVALVVTPWLTLKLLGRHLHSGGGHSESRMAGRLHWLFEKTMTPFLHPQSGGRRRRWLFAGMAGLVLLAASLAVLQLVVLKMLPFDNKSELQVVVDLPEGRTLEDTAALLADLAALLDDTPEVANYQAYAGTSAPINFNGLVRQYYLRSGANVGDLQINLVDRHDRSRKSHDIARSLRPRMAQLGQRHGASVKVVEVPPGPPVLAPIVAEIYGPDYARSRQIALELRDRFAATAGIVDIDTTVESDAPREVLVVDRARAARLGVSQAGIAEALAAAVGGMNASYLMDAASKYPYPIRLRLSPVDQAQLAQVLDLRVRGSQGQLVPLSELVSVRRESWDGAIHHKDLLPVVYVTADEAGDLDSPLYGMFDIVSQVSANAIAGQRLQQTYIAQSADTAGFAIKWDGEWQITYETFRDMGIAYAAGMVLIYLLVVAQFRSYTVPLIIMAPIPLTVIGVMPGHALLGMQFTATSMIGMIALAGIIVRNSILLVDFINHLIARGHSLEQAVIDACAVRAQPIALTALAAMAGAFFILDDPIFNGLAISLIFGILVSTVLTLVVIPLLYYALLSWQRRRESGEATS
ncbi:efflux RND transporter permease subunit [Pseudoxanthomonas wuyuanensis]|uniref:Multidrug efflux pump subunit AcrB n=1 Tax=Pseudoxanthomonas wuyuanensis TaxID=1073196 RepID=A0A286CVV5_9GAMM|nr:efflux RND transporter permease subunit [Pseudoxanthomonas wuyuanensis]KAF1721266.1 AcrB/AcrD/AcrF family protein [Pseudoxanthomonas wuyuanensis]SOD50523.1 Multidrug efflux pump subunit AcrB [Pseudoxanthomonas wuyuanensis]